MRTRCTRLTPGVHRMPRRTVGFGHGVEQARTAAPTRYRIRSGFAIGKEQPPSACKSQKSRWVSEWGIARPRKPGDSAQTWPCALVSTPAGAPIASSTYKIASASAGESFSESANKTDNFGLLFSDGRLRSVNSSGNSAAVDCRFMRAASVPRLDRTLARGALARGAGAGSDAVALGPRERHGFGGAHGPGSAECSRSSNLSRDIG
jgi:hypothetical protein